jgi:NAD(P)-dependent dehydrogenase (short-subunit alcohol dehydrogenase family)
MRFTGQVALVTGAGSGIGAATAKLFAEEGATVVLADIDLTSVQAARESLDGNHVAVQLDVASPEAWQRAIREFEPVVGMPDILVNNAYQLTVAAVDTLAPDDWRRQIEVNLGAVYYSSHALVPSLREKRGCIVNVGSVHSMVGFPGHPAYAAAKGGVVSLTTQLAVEYGPDIRVNAVLPGSILTKTWDDVSEADRAANAELIPLLRIGEPREVAAAIAFLASADASFITGTTLLVDGGLLAKRGGI